MRKIITTSTALALLIGLTAFTTPPPPQGIDKLLTQGCSLQGVKVNATPTKTSIIRDTNGFDLQTDYTKSGDLYPLTSISDYDSQIKFSFDIPDSAKGGDTFSLYYPLVEDGDFLAKASTRSIIYEAQNDQGVKLADVKQHVASQLYKGVNTNYTILTFTLTDAVNDLNNVKINYQHPTSVIFHRVYPGKEAKAQIPIQDCAKKNVVLIDAHIKKVNEWRNDNIFRESWSGAYAYAHNMRNYFLPVSPDGRYDFTTHKLDYNRDYDIEGNEHITVGYLTPVSDSDPTPKSFTLLTPDVKELLPNGDLHVAGKAPVGKQLVFHVRSYSDYTPLPDDLTSIPTWLRYLNKDGKFEEYVGKIKRPPASASGQGLVADAQFGDTVYLDKNKNGQQDGGEPGVAGVKIDIKGASGFTKTVTTDKNGKYSSGLVKPDKYTVTFHAPSEHVWTKQGKGSVVNAQGVVTFMLDPKQNNLGIDAGLVALDPQLSVQKKFTGMSKDGKLTYRIDVTNKGKGGAKNVVVSEQMTFGGKGTYGIDKVDAGAIAEDKHSWTISEIKPGQTLKGYVSASITSGNPKDVVNTVSIPPTFPCIGEDCESVVAHGSIQVEKKLIRAAEQDVSPAIYKITVKNPGKVAAQGVVIRDIVDSNLNDPVFRDVPQGTTLNKNVWTIGTLAGGQTKTVTVQAWPKVWNKTVTNTIKGSTDITNEAKDCKIEGSVDKDTDMCESVTHQPLYPDLWATKTVRGKNTYHVVIHNKGKGLAKDVSYQDIMKVDGKKLNADISYVKVSQGKMDEKDTSIWHVGDIKAGAKVEATISVKVKDKIDSKQQVRNEFAPLDEPCKGHSCGVVNHGKIQVGKTVVSKEGETQPVVYKLEVKNPTKMNENFVEITDILDDNFDKSTIKIDNVPNGTKVKVVDGKVVWNIDELKAETSMSLTISAKVKIDKLGNKVTNTVKGSTSITDYPQDCKVEGSVDKDSDMCEQVSMTTSKVVPPSTPLAHTGASTMLLIVLTVFMMLGGSYIFYRQRESL